MVDVPVCRYFACPSILVIWWACGLHLPFDHYEQCVPSRSHTYILCVCVWGAFESQEWGDRVASLYCAVSQNLVMLLCIFQMYGNGQESMFCIKYPGRLWKVWFNAPTHFEENENPEGFSNLHHRSTPEVTCVGDSANMWLSEWEGASSARDIGESQRHWKIECGFIHKPQTIDENTICEQIVRLR